MKMSLIALTFAGALIIIGVGGFAAYGAKTALIPAYLGIALAICGGMAVKPEWKMHAMHGAALVGLLGFLGALPGLLKLPALFSGAYLARPHAVALQSLTAILCLVFLGLCIKSFIAARVARKKAQE